MFWFYPPVWWIGAKLMDERERDCDEAALVQGGSPGEYARGILQVCENYVGSPLPCAAGISGADLKKRVCKIMTWRKSLPVTLCTKVGLVLGAACAFLVPFGVGIARGQNLELLRQANDPQAPATAHFEVASIKPQGNVPETRDTVGIKVTPGRFHVGFAPVQGLIRYAWGIDPQTRIEGEAWNRMPGRETQYVVDATFDPSATDAQVRQMLQALLAERFQLQLHLSSRDEAYLALEIAPGGPRNLNTKPATAPPRAGSWGGCMATYPGCAPVTMTQFSGSLGLLTRERIVDRTGLTGSYNLTLWCQETVTRFLGAEEAEAASAPSIYTALQQQLGLHLVHTHGPVSVYVIDHIAAPTPN
jgi:bla regulator protein BlaR1